jgi:hypothetical protein
VAGHHHPRPQLSDRHYRSRSLAIQAFGTSHFRVPVLRRVKRRHPASFHHTDKPVLSSDSCFKPCRPKTRIVASLDMESGAALRASRISASLSIKYWSTGAIFGYLSDWAAAFGASTPMPITSTKTMLLITLFLVAALIARCPFAAAARSPL